MEHFIESASSYASSIDGLILLIAVLVGFWFFVAEIVLFWLIVRFRHKDGEKSQYIAGEVKHQKRWVTIPHFIILLCDVVIIVGAIKVWMEVKQSLPEADAKVRIIGQQWAWTFVHPGPDNKLDTPDDITTVDELHLEVGKTYHYELEATDVLHSFSVPVFRLKQDAVPGRKITGWFKPTKEGTFDIQCAEICGIGHGLMVASLSVESPSVHANWIASKASTSAAPTPSANKRPQ